LVRGLLSDEEWAFFAPFVIEAGALRGRPPRNHRRTLDAIFWIARTGAPWRDLPEELGNWNSVHRQYRRWTTSGLWDLMLEALADGGGNDVIQMVDSTSIRASDHRRRRPGPVRTSTRRYPPSLASSLTSTIMSARSSMPPAVQSHQPRLREEGPHGLAYPSSATPTVGQISDAAATTAPAPPIPRPSSHWRHAILPAYAACGWPQSTS